MMFKDEYPEARAEKWKAKLSKLVPVLTDGEAVVEGITKEIDQTVAFWKGVKENPEEQIASEGLKENPRFLDFVCKALQRVIELGEKSNEELDALVEGVQLDQESMQSLEDNVKQTKDNLANDTVQRRQNRFNLIEEKVKNMQEQREDVAIEEVELPKLFVSIRKELASSDQFQKTTFDPDKTRYFLNVSQFLYVKAMVKTLQNRQKFEYRQDTGLPAYQNIQLLDFSDVITQSNDFKDNMMSIRQRIRNELVEQRMKEKEEQEAPPAEGEGEERIPEEHEIEVPVDDRIKAITETISLLSRACQYSQVSKSWMLLENIVKYTWNLISFQLVSPLELSQTDGYKDIFLITESVLNLLSHMKLVSDSEEKSNTSEAPVDDRTVRFEDEKPAGDKRILINEADLKFYSSFIAYTIQCLFVAEKWESMVDLADIAAKQFLTISPDPDDDLLFLLSYLLQFRIYGEDKLYSEASEKTQKVKFSLEERIKEFMHWKATSKKSKSRQALLTGEVPKEEIQFRKDKLALQKEAFRLEVHDTILKSDKMQSEKELDRVKKASNNTKESLRQSRKVYKKYGLETRDLEQEIESHGYNKMMAMKSKNHAIYTNMVIGSYNKSIELIRKRQEKFLLIQSLHEVGNLYYSDNQLRHAETQWNDCVDTIFQRDIGIIKTYRNLFKEVPNIAAVYGSMQCLIGGTVLAKLAKLCYNTNMHLQRECISMGSELFAAPFKVSMFHPHDKVDFIEYRMKEFLPDVTLLSDKQVLQPVDLLSGLDMMSEMLLDYEMYERVLPCATLMNYVATDLVKSTPYMIKARILKGIACCSLGYISQSIKCFYQVIENKDKIVPILNQSEYFKQKEGSSFKFDGAKYEYRNDLPPEAQENTATINELINVNFDLTEQYHVSPLLNSQLSYLKNLIILSL